MRFFKEFFTMKLVASPAAISSRRDPQVAAAVEQMAKQFFMTLTGLSRVGQLRTRDHACVVR